MLHRVGLLPYRPIFETPEYWLKPKHRYTGERLEIDHFDTGIVAESLEIGRIGRLCTKLFPGARVVTWSEEVSDANGEVPERLTLREHFLELGVPESQLHLFQHMLEREDEDDDDELWYEVVPEPSMTFNWGDWISQTPRGWVPALTPEEIDKILYENGWAREIESPINQPNDPLGEPPHIYGIEIDGYLAAYNIGEDSIDEVAEETAAYEGLENSRIAVLDIARGRLHRIYREGMVVDAGPEPAPEDDIPLKSRDSHAFPEEVELLLADPQLAPYAGPERRQLLDVPDYLGRVLALLDGREDVAPHIAPLLPEARHRCDATFETKAEGQFARCSRDAGFAWTRPDGVVVHLCNYHRDVVTSGQTIKDASWYGDLQAREDEWFRIRHGEYPWEHEARIAAEQAEREARIAAGEVPPATSLGPIGTWWRFVNGVSMEDS